MVEPVKAVTSKVFAEAPPVRLPASIDVNASVPAPVSVVFVSVQSTSPAPTTVSVPGPPVIASFPPEPVNFWSNIPAPPFSVSATEVPTTDSTSVWTLSPAKPNVSSSRS